MIDKPYCEECLDIPTEHPCEYCGLGEDVQLWHEACPFGCDLGTYTFGSGLEMECPYCAGEGIGDSHLAHEYDASPGVVHIHDIVLPPDLAAFA